MHVFEGKCVHLYASAFVLFEKKPNHAIMAQDRSGHWCWNSRTAIARKNGDEW